MFKSWFSGKAPSSATDTIDAELWHQVETGLPFLGHLTANERECLRQLALRLLSSKEFSGGKSFVVDNAARLSIALQACLLVLYLGIERYDDWVGIIVYPGDFIIPRQIVDDDGVVHEYDDPVIGEAWQGGPVLISWFTETTDLNGVNVVLHEFAHKLDMQDGVADGMPPLPDHMSRAAWRAAFQVAYDDLCRRVDGGEDTALDPYATEAPAEFFAVMSEAFFQTPHLLREEYPAVYEQLRLFYGQDPALKS
jgi:Mlc titration factor MtfA (ptsG expression regulator)